MRLVKISGGFLEIEETSDQPILPVPPTELPVVQPPLIPVAPLFPIEPPVVQPARTPYFDVGEATGKPGETVEIVVEAGCIHPMNGFHIGGGCGYGLFKATGAVLGPFMRNWLKDEGVIHDSPGHQHDHFWSIFQFVTAGAHPEEWWEFGVSTFSIDLKKPPLPPIPIPGGTELFTLLIEILPAASPGEYTLTCRDEWYYTNRRIRRRDFEYTGLGQGFTAIETFGGKITVKA